MTPQRWYDDSPSMSLPQKFLEHLLACLANQKFINEVNADGLSEGPERVREIQQGIQQAIDDAYHHGWELLMAAAKNGPSEATKSGC